MQRALNIGIIGAGPTGALVASLLRSQLPAAAITVLDKGNASGGRMSTNRSRSIKGHADHGAQYITELSAHCQPYISELVEQGVLQPLEGAAVIRERKSLPNFVAPAGIASIPAYFLTKSGAKVFTSVKATEVNFSPDKKRWRLQLDSTAKDDDIPTEFDALVCTIPAPQILELKGDVDQLLGETPGVKDALGQVKFSSRYALVCYFDPSARHKLDALLPYAGRYVNPDENPAIRYVSYDNRKRGSVEPDEQLAVVVHSSVGFGSEHLEDDIDAMGLQLLQQLNALYAGLPEPVRLKSHRWRYSQVTQTFPATPGDASTPGAYGVGAMTLASVPPLVLAGDSFSQSHFDGCIYSAEAAVKSLLALLG